MERRSKENHMLLLLIIGLVGWIIPGGGYFVLKENKRGIIVFLTLVLTFGIGLYIGSIGVVDPVGSKPWYIAQIMNSPFVALIGYATAGGTYPVYGKPNEIGQIYTSISGLLNVLCIVNAIYIAHFHWLGAEKE